MAYQPLSALYNAGEPSLQHLQAVKSGLVFSVGSRLGSCPEQDLHGCLTARPSSTAGKMVQLTPLPNQSWYEFKIAPLERGGLGEYICKLQDRMLRPPQ